MNHVCGGAGSDTLSGGSSDDRVENAGAGCNGGNGTNNTTAC